MKDCMNCLWNDKCGELQGEKCEDYSPINDDESDLLYESILRENIMEYRTVVAEYDDGTLEGYNG